MIKRHVVITKQILQYSYTEVMYDLKHLFNVLKSETLVFTSKLTWLTAREDFSRFIRREREREFKILHNLFELISQHV